MKLVSWNVNGIRACVGKGALQAFLESHSPDVVGLQETKISEDQLASAELAFPGYHSVWKSAEKRGYSGVAILTRLKPKAVYYGFDNPLFDVEGRVIGADFGDYIFYSVYFPNGQMNESRLAYKLAFYDAFFSHCNRLVAEGRHVVIAGDYNTAHRAIDLAHPKENETISGFLPIEREWMDRIVDMGFCDTFRAFNDAPGQYSWWTYRAGARERNVGWRIDYLFCDHGLMSRVKDAYILQMVRGSDHCPVGITL